MRGYCGIAIYEPKFEENIGTLFRSAQVFGVDFIALIGKRFKKDASNTTSSERNLPIYEYKNLEDFLNHLPVGCEVVSVEIDGRDIKDFVHPQQAIYILGGEDRTLPKIQGQRIKIDTEHCLNVAVAGSIVMFDRQQKLLTRPKQ